MNTVFKTWRSKFAVTKVQQLWKQPYCERNIFKYVSRFYVCAAEYSVSAALINVCKRKFLELTPAIVLSYNKQATRLLNVTKNRCWKCNAVVIERDLVCMSCGSVQEPKQNLNHFEIFKETPHFDIDTRNLTVKFRRLQNLLHPDKFATRSEILFVKKQETHYHQTIFRNLHLCTFKRLLQSSEKTRSLMLILWQKFIKKEKEYSAEQSARVNKGYQILLRPMDRGLYLLELHGMPLLEDEIQLPSEFLAEVMEINEMLDECHSVEVLESLRHVNDAKLQILFNEVSLSFKEKNVAKARTLLCKLKYFMNVDKKIKKLEEKYGISRDD